MGREVRYPGINFLSVLVFKVKKAVNKITKKEKKVHCKEYLPNGEKKKIV